MDENRQSSRSDSTLCETVGSIVRTPIGWREVDFPEIGRGRIKFQGNLVPLGSFLRRSNNFACDALFGGAVLQHEHCVRAEAFLGENERSGGIHAQCGDVHRRGLALQDHMDLCANPEKHALPLPALLRRNGISWCSRTCSLHHRRYRPICWLGGRWGGSGYPRRCVQWHSLRDVALHRSTPQKSSSAPINSTPKSQPSGRCVPFQTMTASAARRVARFVSRSRCCTSISFGLTSRHP